MDESRTMIGLPPAEENGLASAEDFRPIPQVIEVEGRQYAKLPEGWPAAEIKDLEEAHAEAVASEDAGMSEWERELYNWTPEEVQALAKVYVAAEQELLALRKGMKTMQRKTRKQNQVQRRLERRLNQARAGRENLRDQAEQYRDIAAINQGAALELSLQQLRAGERVEL